MYTHPAMPVGIFYCMKHRQGLDLDYGLRMEAVRQNTKNSMTNLNVNSHLTGRHLKRVGHLLLRGLRLDFLNFQRLSFL